MTGSPYPHFDEVRVISLPPPQTAAVNRLLREEEGWRMLEVRVVERRLSADGAIEPYVVYVLGHEPVPQEA
jgi:hypothetical protein